MKPLSIKIAAGTEETPQAVGNYVRSDSSNAVNITINSEETGDKITLKPGDYAKLNPFKRLRISHDGVSDTKVLLYIGNNTEAGSSEVSGDVTATPKPSATLTPLDDVACLTAAATVVAAANTDRRELHITNLGAGTIRVGDATVTASKGIALFANQTGVIPTGAAVSVRNDTGATVTVALMEVSH